ncbi:methyl-accepting chemotaxis protein [Bacteriovorax sp. BSW11_IV]|uniref:methyl-accepting chemotaxis protein n=1 Tax=Bacteriovorax sp. BSW11_IV TaxID=1353529 RepID=UPI0009DB9C71|nr:methyl-accepting chemotaxis protein [Bacteriovorax sp. BSW11_IV]
MTTFFKRRSFRFKLLLLIMVMCLVCICVTSFISFRKSKEALERETVNQMISTSELLKLRIESSLEHAKKMSLRLGSDRLMEGLFLAYEGAFYGGNFSAGKDLNIYSEPYQKLEQIYGDRVREMAKDFNVKNIYLASIDAQIIMSSYKEKDGELLGKNLANGVLKESKLSQCYKAASDSKGNQVFFSGFEYLASIQSASAFFCIKKLAEFDHASEGISKGDVMGVVVSQVDLDDLNKIVTSRVGMGETGQVYLVGEDKTLRSDFFIGKETYNVNNSVKNQIKVETSSVELAQQEKQGYHYIKDPNGYDVLSYYSPLHAFGQTWALIGEKQVSEVFQSISSMLNFIIIASVLTFIAIFFVGFFAIAKMISPVLDANKTLQGVSGHVDTNSNAIKQNSQKLSAGATEIAAAIQETVSTLDELSSMVNKNLENVELSGKKSEESQNVAKKGKDSIASMIVAMDEINQSNQDIVKETDNIGERMQEIINVINEIGEKTKVINDIVFQTKLLAFNASVEAARAGEHGKGFAVVAEEVGSLASASGKAATEIASMLDDSTKKVSDIVTITKQNLEKLAGQGEERIKHGSSRAKECDEVLSLILSNVVEVNEKVQEINYASNEQATGISEVAKAMGQLDELTHSTSSIASMALNSSNELEEESKRLQKIIIDLDNLVNGLSDDNTTLLRTIPVEDDFSDQSLRDDDFSIEDQNFEDDKNVEEIQIAAEEPKKRDEVVKKEDTSSAKKSSEVEEASSLIPSRDDSRFEDI